MNRRWWWQALLAVLLVGGLGVVYLGMRTHADAPPIPDFTDQAGQPLVTRAQILRGQAVFQRAGLMEHGSFFGDGAGRGPDYTAEALNLVARSMVAHLERQGLDPDVALLRTQRDIKANRLGPDNRVPLTPAQVQAWTELQTHYLQRAQGHGPEGWKLGQLLARPQEVRDLTAFFFWGAWVCGAQRPGATASYTHNWPYDPLAGNLPPPSVTFWTVAALLGLALGLGATLYVWGQGEANSGTPPAGRLLTTAAVSAFQPTPTQRASYGFFAIAALLLVVQVLAGILTVHDFVGLTRLGSFDQTASLPIVIPRSWHVQLAIAWIAACWIGASIFLLPLASGGEPRGQLALVRTLLGVLVVAVLGGAVGAFLGPHGLLGDHWRVWGHQGWEFVEAGIAWQVVLFAALTLWVVVVWRGLQPALKQARDPFALPRWLAWACTSVTVLFVPGFLMAGESNFAIADFWRWCVVHMWAEAFFEVFTTVVVAWFLVGMGLATRAGAARAVYGATLLFLGSGLLGISHNFYWNAKPEATLAIGSVFSTLQVVPLLLLALDAWRLRRLPERAARQPGQPDGPFGATAAFRFLLAVSFWNFLGAGVFGLIINLPIVNYYEHGTYLTVNHGHAALMGVYGNLSLAALLHVARHLIRPERWSEAVPRLAFWSVNVGLAAMVLGDLLPVGVLQLQAVLDGGLWHARSQAFVQGEAFQTFTWLRLPGGALFVLGGVLPLAWLTVSRWPARKTASEQRIQEQPSLSVDEAA